MTTRRHREVIDRIATTATEAERTALIAWADRVLTVYESDASSLVKLKDVVSATSGATTIKAFVAVIGKELTPSELQQLSTDLADLNRTDLPAIAQAKRGAVLVATALKDLAWDNRGLPARLGIGTAVVTVIAFGGQGAGIAALGTAIGVPLWVVFGAGAVFIGELYERLTGTTRNPRTTHTVIDSEHDDAR